MTTIASHTPLQAAAADATARIRFVVVLEGAAGDEGPHLRTLRFVLKHLLRSRSLRCTSVTEVRLDPRDVRRADDGDGGTPSAQIVQLPRRDRGAIHVECVEGDWLSSMTGKDGRIAQSGLARGQRDRGSSQCRHHCAGPPTKRLPTVHEGEARMLTAQELLERNGIRLSDYKPGQHCRTCPRCSAKRSKAHQSLKVLSVKIDADGATWHCNHCGWAGPEKGNGKSNGAGGEFDL